MYLRLFLVFLLMHHDVHGVQLETFKTLATLVGQRIKEGAVNTIHEGAMLTQNANAALRYMADTVVTTTLLGCLQLIPNTVNIPPLDLDLNLGGPGHLSADNGRLQGLSTVRVQSIVYDFDDEENLMIKFPITFTNLHIVYERFQLDCWPVVMTGGADLKFTDGEVNMNIKLTRPADLLQKLTKKECVFHVGSVQFSGFHEMEPNIKIDGDNDHKFLNDHVFPVVAAEIKKVMLHIVDVRVTNSLYDSLPMSGSWVCRDADLKRLTLLTTGPITFTPVGISNWLPDSAQDQGITMDSNFDIPLSKVAKGKEFYTPEEKLANDSEYEIPDMNISEDLNFETPAIHIYHYNDN